MMKKLPWLFAVLAIAACGGSSSGGPGATSSSGGSSGGSSGTSGGNPGLVLGAGAMDGVWDVILSNPKTGRETIGTITISPTLFAMAFPDFDLNGALNAGVPDISYNFRGDTKKLGATLSQQPFDLGAFGYPVGGDWVFKGDTTEGCTASVKVPTMSLECDGLPSEIRSSVEGTSSAQRISTLASSFGDLGGKWTVLVPKNKCEATFEGANFTATCEGSPNVLTVTFDGTTASGSLADSFELSAKRR